MNENETLTLMLDSNQSMIWQVHSMAR